MATVDLAELRRRSEYIKERRHSTLPLLIWNYNARCQAEKAWDEYTRIARGLITDLEGRIVARPFPKFFNLGEVEKTRVENLPADPPRIYEKLDGSLGILYWDGDRPCIATRGSFESEQAAWATEWVRERVDRDITTGFRIDHTYLFEIVFPQNRIVVDYGARAELVLLAVVHTETGRELDPIKEAVRIGLPGAREFLHPLEDVQASCATLGSDEEGFVVHWPSYGLRVKMKGAEYCRLHKLLTSFSSISIWECLAAGTDLEPLMERVPDEFRAWVMDQRDSLKWAFRELQIDAEQAVRDVNRLSDRKTQALYLQAHHADVQHFAFMLLNGKDPAPLIWKRLRPAHALPFRFGPEEGEVDG